MRNRSIGRWAAGILTATSALVGPVAIQGQAAAATDADYGRMLLVLDSSGSMKEPASGGVSKIEAARTALDTVIDELPEDADVGLRVFGASVFSRSQPGACTDSRLVVPPGTGNRAELRAAVGRYRPYGETPIAHALRRAADDIGTEGRRSIVLVSDGIATCRPDPCRVAAQIAKRGIDLQVNVVGLGVAGKARRQLRCIAGAGGGKYYDADSAEEIAESLTVASTRAVRRYRLDGEPVEGGASAIQALPLERGQYVDRIEDGSPERWYSYRRTIPGSTVLAGVNARRVDDNFASLGVRTFAASGESCASDVTMGNVAVETVLLGASAWAGGESVGSTSREGCASEDEVHIQVATGEGDEGRIDYSLRLVELPPVPVDQSGPPGFGFRGAPEATAQVSGKPVAAIPGTSFEDATEISEGIAASAIVPGEIQVFKVRLDWGQRLAVRLRHPYSPGPSFVLGSLDLFTPMRVPVSATAESSTTGYMTQNIGPRTASTRPVRWNNLAEDSLEFLPGWYYLVYSSDYSTRLAGQEFPYTIEVDVQGEAEEGPPALARVDLEDLLTTPVEAAPTQEASDAPSEDASQSPGTSTEDPSSDPEASGEEGAESAVPWRMIGAVGLILAGIALLVIAARLALRR